MLKSFPKILTIFFLTVFILQIICLFFLLTVPMASQAADIKFTPQVQGLNYTFNAADKTTGNIANLVKAVYNYAIGIVGILAAVILMYGGVRWIVAGGNATQVGEAKAWIGAALTGLVLALTSYLILSTINPALVNLQTTPIPGVKEAPKDGANIVGCCLYDGYSAGNATYYQACTSSIGFSQADCTAKNPNNPQATSYIQDRECYLPLGGHYECGVVHGSCWKDTSCTNNTTAEACANKSGIFTINGDCSKPPADRGSCTTSICEENYTQADCNNKDGIFELGKKCINHVCTNPCVYSAKVNTASCELLGQVTTDPVCCQGKQIPTFCQSNINDCYCCCAR